VWAVVVASTVTVIDNVVRKDAPFRQSMDDVERVVLLQGIPDAIARKIKEYFIKFHQLQAAKGTRALIARMSPDLQARVTLEVYQDWVEDVHWFQHISHACLVRLILRMTNLLFIPRETIPSFRAICFVIRGTALLGGHLHHKGDSWGQDCILDNVSLRKNVSGHALTFVEVIRLERSDMDDVLEEFPEDNLVRRKAHCWMIVVRGCQMLSRQLKVRAIAAGAFLSLPHKNNLLDNFYTELEKIRQLEPIRAFHDDVTHGLDRQLDNLKEVVFEQVQLQSAMTVASLRMKKLVESLKAKVEEEERVLGINKSEESPALVSRVTTKQRNSFVPSLPRAMSNRGRQGSRRTSANGSGDL